MLWTEWLLTINPLSNPATTKLPNHRERRRHFQNPSGSKPKQTAIFTQGHSALIARGDDRDASQKEDPSIFRHLPLLQPSPTDGTSHVQGINTYVYTHRQIIGPREKTNNK